jgi:DNA repair exonuclease SbcCD nuclease subunit
MTQIIVANDLHLADHPPANRREGYREEGLAMLGEVVQIANERAAEAIVFTGDIFHLKAPQRTSHALVGAVICALQAARCPVYVVPGNHDVTEEGLASLHRQPLYVLAQAGAVRLLLADGTPTFTASGARLVGRPYDTHRDADPAYYALRGHEISDAPTLVFAHGSIVPDHEDRPYPTVRLSQLDWTGIDVLASGHIHEDLGTHRAGSAWFTNVGSLGRVARTEANLTRTVKVVSISLAATGIDVEEIPLASALPADAIFLEDAPVVEEDDDTIVEFVRSLRAGLRFESVDLLELVQQADVPNTVRTYLRQYLELAGA